MTSDGFLMGVGLATKMSLGGDAYLIVSTLPDCVAFTISVTIVIITCIIQLRTLYKSSQLPTSSNQRHVTITVLLMSTLFVLCNSPYSIYFVIETIFVLIGKFELWTEIAYGQTLYAITMLSTAVLPILNAALNPVIIITRSSSMRRKLSHSLQGILRWLRVRQE